MDWQDRAGRFADVLIIGAGISGIGAAYRIHEKNPQLSYTDPGAARAHRRHVGPVPLSGHPLRQRHLHAEPALRAVDAARERGRRCRHPRVPDRRGPQARHRRAHPVRHPRQVGRLGLDHRHLDRATTEQDGAEKLYRGRFLFFGTGYYNYDEPYTPEFPGIEDFAGDVVHPQFWPESLDYAGKRVVVIGSGATAISLIPALAREGRARDDAAALADLHDVHGARSIRWCRSSGRCCRARLAHSVVRFRNAFIHVVTYVIAPQGAEVQQVADPQPDASRHCPRATTSTSTSSRGTTRGTNGCA